MKLNLIYLAASSTKRPGFLQAVVTGTTMASSLGGLPAAVSTVKCHICKSREQGAEPGSYGETQKVSRPGDMCRVPPSKASAWL